MLSTSTEAKNAAYIFIVSQISLDLGASMWPRFPSNMYPLQTWNLEVMMQEARIARKTLVVVAAAHRI